MTAQLRGVKPPRPYGLFATAEGLGGLAAPLLAGFAITLLALVLQVESALLAPDWGMLLLGVAALLMLQVVQLNARARGYAVTPADVESWYPELDKRPERRHVIEWELRHYQACWRTLIARARIRYNLGVVVLLAGTAVILVPADAGRWTVVRVLAVAVLALGALGEAAAALGSWARTRRRKRWAKVVARMLRWASPADPPVPPPPWQPYGPSGAGAGGAAVTGGPSAPGPNQAPV